MEVRLGSYCGGGRYELRIYFNGLGPGFFGWAILVVGVDFSIFWNEGGMGRAGALRPLLGTVKNTDNLDRLFLSAVNNHEREPGNREFTRTGLASRAATERHVFQGVGRVIDCHSGAVGLRGYKSLFRIVANMSEVVRRWLGPTNDHLRRIPGFDHSENGIVLNELAFIRRCQSLIDFAGEPLVIAQKPFDSFLH